jgi:GNAT superfamily N-acetyltransferase
MKAPQLTHKVIKLIQQADRMAKRHHHASIQSIDLFIGASLVKEGALKEMHDLLEPYTDKIERLIETLTLEPSSGILMEPFSIPLSSHAHKIWTSSIDIMKRYNQTFLNEGHIIQAFFSHITSHPQLEQVLMEIPKKQILQSVTTARDLTVNLLTNDWNYNELQGVVISKVQPNEEEAFLSWVKHQFGERWFETLSGAFRSSSPVIPIFKAEEKGELVGFAAYDVYMNKKGIFGPMGVIPATRLHGVGKRLLYTALHMMKERGYLYAVLKEAGPIEFYEMTCGAKLIPLDNSR